MTTYDVSPITTLVDCVRPKVLARHIRRHCSQSSPYSGYPRDSMSLLNSYMQRTLSTQFPRDGKMCRTSAYWGPLNPGVCGASEKPNPGRLGATTWKLGWSSPPAVKRGSIFFTSRKCPGPTSHRNELVCRPPSQHIATYTHERTAAGSRPSPRLLDAQSARSVFHNRPPQCRA